MSAFATLSGDRVRLRRWRDEDRHAFAVMNSDPRVMEFFRERLSRADSDAMADRIEQHFCEHGFGLWAIEVPGGPPFIGFARIVLGAVQRAFHALRGSRLASGLRALGTWLCNGGGPIGAWLRVRPAWAHRNRILHIRDQPSLSRSHGTARHVSRSCGGFRLPFVSGRSSAAKACALPARFGFICRHWLISPRRART